MKINVTLYGDKAIVILTGAGISAESGIPTFRGEDGFWTVGSHNYYPEEMATNAAFREMPFEVWSWYLYRLGVCLRAQPNAAHHAIAKLQNIARPANHVTLITQNVDALHLTAGSPQATTFQVHGNAHFMRCSTKCGTPIQKLPEHFHAEWDKERRPTEEEKKFLTCSHCGALNRPHVLWFDECYDEENFHFDSSLRAIDEAELLIVIGTTGVTNLPNQICQNAMRRQIKIICIDPFENELTQMVQDYFNGNHVKESAVNAVPLLVEELLCQEA